MGGWVGVVGRVFSIAATVAAAGVAVLVVIGATQVTRTALSISSEPLRDAAIAMPGLPSPPPADQPGLAGKIARGERFTLLILGYGGGGHDGAFLSDTMLLAIVRPADRSVALLSIPRDLWVPLPPGPRNGPYSGKINEAFSLAAGYGDRDGGMKLAAGIVSGVTGLVVDRTIALDFNGFRSLVDAIGGVDVTVDRAFSAAYPRNDDADIDASWITVSFAAGAQHMNGERALRFSRARYSDGPEGSDYARSARQQKIILAAKDRIVSAGLFPSLLGVLESLRDNVRTDLSLSDMGALAELARGYDDARTTHAGLSTANVLADVTVYDGRELVFSGLRPRVSNWSEVRAYAASVADGSAALGVSPGRLATGR